jgi:hypothetical protein
MAISGRAAIPELSSTCVRMPTAANGAGRYPGS